MAVESRPLRKDAERNRRRLLDAARELFAERGLAVTMDEIARHAGVGVGTAYRRFASREELVDALFDERIESFLAMAEDTLSDPDPLRALTTFLERSTELQTADRGLKQLLHRAGRGRERAADVRARLLPLIDGVVRRGCEQGALRCDLAGTDIGLVAMMASSVADLTHDLAPDLWRRHLALLLDGLRAPGPLPGEALTSAQLESAMDCWEPGSRV